MSDAVINTRVELLAEAIETLVQVSVHGQLNKLSMNEARKQHDLVVQARSALGDAVRLCLTPVLRVVTLEPTPRPSSERLHA